MGLSKSFKNRFWSSFWVFALLLSAIFIIRNKRAILLALEGVFHFQIEQSEEQKALSLSNQIPLGYLPLDNFGGEVIYKPNYIVYYDDQLLNARYTLHFLKGKSTRGSASRNGLRFDEHEKVLSHTPQWADFSGSGYDRGHLVPSGDFQCCQELLEDTFAMTNIAPFDSVLNRYAWQDLEKQVRAWARKYNNLVVFTGPVFSQKKFIGKSNRIRIPSGFFKLVFVPESNNTSPRFSSAFFIPNKPLKEFSKEKYLISVDDLELLTDLDFFKYLGSQEEKTFEAKRELIP